MKNNNVRIPRPPPSIYKDLADHSIFPAQATFDVPSVAHNEYSYTPLDQGQDETRLLSRGQPALIDGQNNYTLRHVSLVQDPEYEALSYTWADVNGRNDKDKHIFIDGHVVRVGANLAAALSQLFSGDVDRKLWIDALCINQTDTSERNMQVSKMSIIYSKATNVVLWLGPEYSNSEGAFRILRSFKDKGLGKTLYQTVGPWNFELIPPDTVIQDIHAIVRLYRRGYWTRSWIVQEVSFAKTIILYCGNERMTWEELMSASEILAEGSSGLMTALTGSSIGHVFYDLFSSGPRILDTGVHTPIGTINEVITRHRTKLVFDPRDRVYSVRSLMAPEKQALIPINYELDAEALFKSVSILIINEEKDLTILAENKTFVGQASIATRDRVSSDLPSWVPEWLITSLPNKIRVDRVTTGGGVVSASGVGSTAECTVEGSKCACFFSPFCSKLSSHGRDTILRSSLYGNDMIITRADNKLS